MLFSFAYLFLNNKAKVAGRKTDELDESSY